jgi:hypothetical protein
MPLFCRFQKTCTLGNPVYGCLYQTQGCTSLVSLGIHVKVPRVHVPITYSTDLLVHTQLLYEEVKLLLRLG